MTQYTDAIARCDTRGAHDAYMAMRRSLHIALAKHEYGNRSKRTKAIKEMME